VLELTDRVAVVTGATTGALLPVDGGHLR